MARTKLKKYALTTEERIEILARMAAEMRGQTPDGHLSIRIGDRVIYKGVAWQDPDNIASAKSALDALRRRPDAGNKPYGS